LDAAPPLGSDKGITPKQALLLSVAGCSAMDVAALLKKFKQPSHVLKLSVEGPLTDGYPSVFSSIAVEYSIEGDVDPEKFKEAVKLSMTKYCGVSAMVTKACPINYTLKLNGEEIAREKASF
jgi:putative redox protein